MKPTYHKGLRCHSNRAQTVREKKTADFIRKLVSGKVKVHSIIMQTNTVICLLSKVMIENIFPKLNDNF